MNVNQELRDHPFWAASDPSRMRLVRISPEFPPCLNPFVGDDVVIQAAGVPGEVQHSKWIIAREGILDGIEKGLIGPDTNIIEATSGNTGEGMARVCNALGLRFTAAMSVDVPESKVAPIRAMGGRTAVHLLSDSDETTVEYARRLGAQKGWYNPCQYDGNWNWRAQYKYLAPQLWAQQPKISLFFVPGGTMCTGIGPKMYAGEKDLGTVIVPVLCAEGEEVPGARTLSSVRKDVRQPWELLFLEEQLQFGKRHPAFFLSFLSWPHMQGKLPHLGPSFGLALAGALSFLEMHKRDGTLDQFREKDGKIYVLVFGPDDCRPYLPLYFGELKKWELSARVPPTDLLSVLDT
jgi:hypothetical protein